MHKDRAVKTTFGHRLFLCRTARKLTQQQVTDKLIELGDSLRRGTIGHYEQGVSMPDGTRLARLAKVLRVSTDFLLGLDEAPCRRQA